MDISYYKKREPFFGSWKIKRLLGEGSFGKVFEIERNEFGHCYTAAMKAITIPQSESEIRSIMSDGMDVKSVTDYYHDFVEEVIREFELMSKLKGNSNIVSYEDHEVVEHQEGIGWDILIRMELLTPLLEHLKKNIMSEQEILSLGIDICKALESCQKYHIIHRDIKPENIFLSPNGDFKLGDFGIARTMEKTVDDMSKKGTYTYMAPEVYKGENYGSSVDIYSLGIVLYRLLNHNRAPFLPSYPDPITYGDRQKATMRRISGEKIPRPSRGSEEFVRIVLKACAYRPEDRYDSPEDMRKELEILSYGNSRALSDDSTEILSQENTGETEKLIDDTETQILADDMEKPIDTEKHRWNFRVTPPRKAYAAAIVLLCLVLSVLFAKSIAGKDTKVKMADLENMKKQQALDTLEKLGLVFDEENSEELYHDEVPAGCVIFQSVGENELVSKGTAVSLVFSKGPEDDEEAAFLEVPLFVGMTQEEVEAELQKLKKETGYTFVVADYHKEYSVNVPKGKVAAQSLQPGTMEKSSAKLYLSLSLGPKKVSMPLLLNMKEQEAVDALKKLNLGVQVRYQQSSNVSSGYVIAQSVGEKESVYEGTTVELVVSQGAAPAASGSDSASATDGAGETYNGGDSDYSAPQSAGTSSLPAAPQAPASTPDTTAPSSDVVETEPDLGDIDFGLGSDSDSDSDFGSSDSDSDSDSDFDSGYSSSF